MKKQMKKQMIPLRELNSAHIKNMIYKEQTDLLLSHARLVAKGTVENMISIYKSPEISAMSGICILLQTEMHRTIPILRAELYIMTGLELILKKTKEYRLWTRPDCFQYSDYYMGPECDWTLHYPRGQYMERLARSKYAQEQLITHSTAQITAACLFLSTTYNSSKLVFPKKYNTQIQNYLHLA